ncbi:MAG: CPBP family intramembrane glutamic endopeptidase [Acidobacteriota bacterium]
MSDDQPLQPGNENEAQIQPPTRGFPVWTAWDILLLLFFAGFALLFVGTLALSVSHLVKLKFPDWALWRHPAREGLAALLLQILLDAVLLLYVYFTITLKYGAPFLPSLRWTSVPARPARFYLSLGFVLALTILGLSAVLPTPAKPPIEQLLRHKETAFLFAAMGVLVAPFVEEVIFRGFIFPVIEKILGKVGGIVITAGLFTSVHVGQLWGSWSAVALILLVGTVLSTARALTGSLTPSFLIHLSYNATITLLFLMGVLVKGFPV